MSVWSLSAEKMRMGRPDSLVTITGGNGPPTYLSFKTPDTASCDAPPAERWPLARERRCLMPNSHAFDSSALVSELMDGVFVSKMSGELLYANQSFANMMDRSLEELMKLNVCNDLAERPLEWKALVSLLEQGGLIADYEIKLRRADGRVLCVSLSAGIYRDREGMPVGLTCVARDISTRKGVEHELRDKAFRIEIMNKIAKMTGSNTDIGTILLGLTEELHKLVNFEHISIGVTEDKGRHVELLGSDPERPGKGVMLGKVPFEGSLVEKLKYERSAVIIEKDAGRRLYSEFSVLKQTGANSALSVPLISRGRTLGSLNILHSRPSEYNYEVAETLQMVADQIAGLVDNMVLLNTLEQKVRLHETLLRCNLELQKAISTEQIYEAIAHNIREIVPYKDISVYTVDWSTRMVFPVFAGGSFTEAVMSNPGTVDEGIVGAVAKSGHAEFVDDVDADPRAADVPGTPMEHNSMLAIPLHGPNGVLGVLELYRSRGEVFSASDLEAGKLFAQQASIALVNAQLVSKLSEAKKEIEMLNDLMFHDINNFNFATMNYIEAMMADKQLSHEHRAYLEKSLHLIRQNAKLIENVKKLTRIGAMDPTKFTPIDLADLLRKTASGLQAATPNKRVSVRVDAPDSGVLIMANPLIEELFVNLIGNAIKYDDREEVEVEVSCERLHEPGKHLWKICITDNGPGIPDEKKSMLFQRYVRLKPDPKVAGTGLGLSICRELVDKFGGKIWVEDRVKGKSELGTRFCTLFPAAK